MTAAGAVLSARCLRGAVTFAARPTEGGADICRCTVYQRRTDGMPAAVMLEDLAERGEPPGVHRSVAERVSCTACGAGLDWRMRDGFVAVVDEAALEPPPDMPLAGGIFIDEKPAGYDLAGERRRLTRAGVVALFAGGTETEPRAD